MDKAPVIEIDARSGFCHGVVAAIRKAEEELERSQEPLYCLGDIVHNSDEVERLGRKGLSTITHADLDGLHDVRVLLRAHGEPPSTYSIAKKHGIEIVDATCPVVLKLQQRIKEAFNNTSPRPQNSNLWQSWPCGSKRTRRTNKRRGDRCRKYRTITQS